MNAQSDSRGAILQLVAQLPPQHRLNFLRELWHEVGQNGADNHFWTTYNSNGLFACITASAEQLRDALARVNRKSQI